MLWYNSAILSQLSMSDNPNMKKNDLSKRRCWYRADEKTNEQAEKLHALIQESSINGSLDPTDRKKKALTNLE